MPLFVKHNEPLWSVWKIEESSDELLAMLEHKDWYQSFLSTIKTEKRKQEWLACRVLLKNMLGEEKQIAYNTEGAPYLRNSSLYISFSHTKGFVAVRVSKRPAVGIDIEYRTNRVMKIRSRFMNPEEEAVLDKHNEIIHLLIHWCAKETLFKMIGQKDVDFLRHLHVKPMACLDTAGSFFVQETRTVDAASYRLGYLATDLFVLTWSEE